MVLQLYSIYGPSLELRGALFSYHPLRTMRTMAFCLQWPSANADRHGLVAQFRNWARGALGLNHNDQHHRPHLTDDRVASSSKDTEDKSTNQLDTNTYYISTVHSMLF